MKVQELISNDELKEDKERNLLIIEELEKSNLICQRNIFEDYLNYLNIKPSK